MADRNYDYLFKVLLCGDSGVGKTCLISQFTDQQVRRSHITTIGEPWLLRSLLLFCKSMLSSVLCLPLQLLWWVACPAVLKASLLRKGRVCCCQCWSTWLLSGTPLAGVFKGTIIHYSVTWFCAGIDFKLKTFTVQGKRIRLQIWWACAWLMSSLIALVDE